MVRASNKAFSHTAGRQGPGVRGHAAASVPARRNGEDPLQTPHQAGTGRALPSPQWPWSLRAAVGMERQEQNLCSQMLHSLHPILSAPQLGVMQPSS